MFFFALIFLFDCMQTIRHWEINFIDSIKSTSGGGGGGGSLIKIYDDETREGLQNN